MGKKRVYEAARRLNLETSELMKLLQQQGITVKSPISFISEDDFEKVSSSFASSQEKSEQQVGDDENKQETAAVDEEIEEPSVEEPEPKKEADVIPISRSRKGDEKDEQESDEEGSAAEDTNTTEQAVPSPAPSGEETPQQELTTHQPELAPTGTGGFTAAVSYMAMGLAAGALIATFALYQNVNESAARLDQLATEGGVVKADAIRANEGVAVNKSMAEKNLSLATGAIEQVNNVRRDVSAVEESVIAVDGKLVVVQGQALQNQTGLTEAQGEIDATKTELQTTQNQLEATRTEVAATQKQVLATQAQVNETQTQVSKIEGQVTVSRMSELKGDLKARSSSLAELAAISSGPASQQLSDIAQRVSALSDSMQ